LAEGEIALDGPALPTASGGGAVAPTPAPFGQRTVTAAHVVAAPAPFPLWRALENKKQGMLV